MTLIIDFVRKSESLKQYTRFQVKEKDFPRKRKRLIAG